jgi:hypothetical protein
MLKPYPDHRSQEVHMVQLTLKEQRQQVRKWYLMNNSPVPDYLKDENHHCNPDAFEPDVDHCPACREMRIEILIEKNLGKYR